jgi:hypothetical protein
VAGVERQILLSFSLAPCVSPSHSQAFPVPLPPNDVAASLNDIKTACILSRA